MSSRSQGAAAPREGAVTLSGGSFPVLTIHEALPELRRPFAAEAVKWKVQSAGAEWALVVGYIDARLVIERLNLVVGGEWSARYDGPPAARWCWLDVMGTTRADLGVAAGPMAEKGSVSDALKRAAVHFGIGVSIYALRHVRLTPGQHGALIRPTKRWDAKAKTEKPSQELTEEGHEWLRERYQMWLDAKGILAFGEPLDHGDEATDESHDEADEPVMAPPVPAQPPALETPEALEMVAMARAQYEDLRSADPGTDLTPAKFEAWLGSASRDHADLQKLLDGLHERNVAAEAKGGRR